MSRVLESSASSGAPSSGQPVRPARGALLRFLAFALGLGAVVGVLWWQVVDLPAYLVGPDGGASTSERGLTGFVAGDAWFTLLGALAGLLLGWLGWAKLKNLGWPLVLVVVLAAVAAALVCWLVGYLLGPGNFNARLAQARPGDEVLIQLTIRARASLLVWPFVAIIPVLLGSSLGRDDEEPRPRSTEPFLRRSRLGRALRRDRDQPPQGDDPLEPPRVRRSPE
jgi:hypothetical protein